MLGVFALFSCGFVFSTNFTWTGGGSPLQWNDPVNWSPDAPDIDGYPNDSSDNVIINSAAVSVFGDVVCGAITITGSSSLTINGKLTNTGAITSSGNISLGSYEGHGASIDCAGSFTATSGATFRGHVRPSSISIGGDVIFGSDVTDVTTAGNQSYGGVVKLNNNFNFESASGTVTFNSNVQSLNANLKALSITGNAVFVSAIGLGTSLSSVSVSGTTSVGGDVTTSGNQTYGSDVTLTSGNATFTGSTVSFSAKVDGSSSLSVAGDAVFGGAVGSVTALSSVSVSGTTSVGGDVTTSGNQTYGSDVTLTSGNATFTGSTVSFSAKVDGSSSLSVAGDAVFGGAVGSVTALSSISVSGTTSVGGDVTTSGNQTYSGNLTLTADSVFSSSGAIAFGTSSANTVTTSSHTLTANSGTSNSVTFNSSLSSAKIKLVSSTIFKTDNSFSSFEADSSVNSSAFTVTFEDNSTQAFTNFSCNGTSGKEITLTSASQSSSSPWKAVFSTKPTSSSFAYTLAGYCNSVTASNAANELDLIPSTATVKDLNTSSPATMTTKYWFTQEFVWNGTTDSSWTTASNWQYSNGTTALTYPDDTKGTSQITIADSALNALVLSSAVYINKISVGTSSSASCKVELSNFALNTSYRSGSNYGLTNFGTIVFSGSGRFYYKATSSSSAVLIMDNARGTVEYNGASGNITDIYNGSNSTSDYYKLLIKSGTWTIQNSHSSNENNIKAASSFTVNSGATLVLEDTAVVNSALVNRGILQVDSGTAGIWANFTNAPGATVQNDGNLLFTKECQSVSDGGSWTFGSSGKVLFSATNSDISFTETATANSSNSFKFDTSSFNSNSLSISGVSNSVLLKIASYTGGGSGTINFSNTNFLQTAPVFFSGTVTLSDVVKLAGTLRVGSGQTTLAGTVAANAVDIANSAKLIGGASKVFTVKGSWTNANSSGGFVANTSEVIFELSADSSLSLTGTEIFYKLAIKNHKLTATNAVSVGQSLSITDSASFSGTSLVTSAGATANFNALNSDSAPIVRTSGNQTYGGALTLGVNCFLQGATVTFAGAVEGTYNLKVSGNANFNSTVGSSFALKDVWVTGNAEFGGVVKSQSIDVSGTTKIKTASITTTGVISSSLTGESQRYAGDVTLGANAVLTAPSTKSIGFGAGITDGANSYAMSIAGADVAVAGAINIDGSFTAGANASVAGAVNCAAVSVTGNALFGSDVTSSASITIGGTTSAGGNITSNTTQIYTTLVTIGTSGVEFKSTAGDINFGTSAINSNLITGNSGYGFTVNTTGSHVTNFYGVIANNPELTIKGNANIYQTNSFTSLIAQSQAGKTLTFGSGKKQTITSKIFLSGTQDSKLNLTSTGQWELFLNPNTIAESTSSYGIEYVDIKNCKNITKNGSADYYLTALKSSDSGNNIYWNFPGMEYVWSGGTSDWFTAGNWVQNSVPGRGSTVKIPAVASPSVYPLLTADIDISYPSYSNLDSDTPGTITVEESAEIDFATFDVTAGEFTNNGLVKLNGKSISVPQTILATMTNGSSSTVEYGGTDLTDFVWDGSSEAGFQYQKLRIKGSAVVSSIIEVSGTTLINTSGDVSLSGANIFTGDVSVSSTGDVQLNASSEFSLSAGATCKNLNIVSPVVLKGAVTSVATQIYGSTVKINGNLTGTVLTFKGDLDVRNAVSFDASSKIEFSKAAAQNVSGTMAVKFDCPTVSFTSDLTIANPINFAQSTGFAGGTKKITFNQKVNSLGSANDVSFTCGNAIFNSSIGETLALKVLSINGNAEFSGAVKAESVDVSETTKIKTAGITTTGVIASSLTGESQRYAGDVTLGANAVLTAPSTKLIRFAAGLTDGADSYSVRTVGADVAVAGQVSIGGSFTAGANARVTGSVTCAAFSVTSNAVFASDVTSSASITVGGTTKFSSSTEQNVSSTLGQTYTGDVEISSGVKFKARGDFSIDSVIGPGSFDAKVYDGKSFTASGTLGRTTALSSIDITAGKLQLNGFNSNGTADFKALPSTAGVFGSGTTANTIKMISGDYVSSGAQNFNAVGGVRVLNAAPLVWNANANSITLLNSPLFVDSSSTLALLSSISAHNIYFYSGNISCSSSITSVQDFAIWGSASSYDDPRFAGTDTRFAYYGYDSLIYKASSTFGTSLSFSGATLTIGKNFYLNGANLSGATISIQDNSQSNPVFNSSSAVTEKQWGIPYAVAFNSTLNNLSVTGGWLCAGAVDSETHGQTQGNTLAGTNANVQGSVPRIKNAYSVYDDVVFVEFDMPLENSNGEIATNIGLTSSSTSAASGGIFYSNGTKKILSVYTDSDCTTSLTKDAGDVSSFYIRAEETWNTDATGTTSYNALSTNSLDSTDRSGTHKNLTTDLSILEGMFTAANGHTMSRNYGAGLENSSVPLSFNKVEDRASPVLIAVYTGQEKHSVYDSIIGATSQNEYDSHNFIEFKYSEAVNIGNLAFNAGDLNARATVSFANNSEHGAHITGSGTTANGNGLTVEGFAHLSSGKLICASKGSSDSPHALYRKFSTTSSGSPNAQTHRLRLSVAGYVDGTVTHNSNLYRNWVGYIDSAQTPSGAVTRISNSFITDIAKDKDGNNIFTALDSVGTENHPLGDIVVNSTTQELYGLWDVLPPVIAPFITSGENWNSWAAGSHSSFYEIIGASTGSYIESIEVHLFDNNKNQNSSLGVDYWWKSKKGWMENIKTLPDTFGGARPFVNSSVTAQSQTTGGIRRSSLAGENSSFSYIVGSNSEKLAGSAEIGQVVRSSLFRSSTDNATASDGLYLSIPVNDTDTYLPIRSAFNFYYEPANSFITDLAGNRLASSYSQKTSFASVDLTAPSYVMSLAPIGNDKVYVIFTKKLAYTDSNGDTYAFSDLDTTKLEEALGKIKNSFRICQKQTNTPYSGISIASVEYVSSSDEYTAFLFNLVGKITLDNIKNLWIRNIGHGTDTVGDIVTGDPISDTKIHDFIGNYLTKNKAHAISDFAVNAVDVLYAHALPKDNDDWDEQGIYGNDFESKAENYAVHDFSETQGNYGKLVRGRDIVFRTRIIAGLDANGDYIPSTDDFIFLATNKNTLTSLMISDKFNRLTGSSWRVWLPSTLTSLASLENTNPLFSPTRISVDSTLYDYKFASADFSDVDEIQFLFEVQGVTIDHDADFDPSFFVPSSPTAEIPLYALWMPENKINSKGFPFVDLWSFGIKDVSLQRGGVSILNNVINVNVREKTVIQVDQARDGILNVFVMTLDGNIVKRLSHGTKSQGTHFFQWDGTNNAGNPVARGLYFVRVTGPEIDETRKVLCVKE
ncbi:FlgD immunoglobulin-like domain containing protein [Treponema pectinovorum]|uniref:FlgD immunoglobulin-like domain containing protein n=1 Tax=Treponema pectinovorum TaxID=164 RepID=UPI00164E7939|nr:FlgD immunoglobulin-like domain containing protein [Treponema pectinovorum]